MYVTMARRIIAVILIQLVFVQAYVSYLPSEEDMDDETNEVSDLQAQSLEDKMFYKLLNNIMLDNLYKLQQRQYSDYIRDSTDSFKSSKRFLPDFNTKRKRKVFWQPLGYLPGGTNQDGSSNQANSASNSRVFRYG